MDNVFLNPDPLGFGGGQTNLSEFCGNSPTNATDPSGCDSRVRDGFAAGMFPRSTLMGAAVNHLGDSAGDVAQGYSDDLQRTVEPANQYAARNSVLGSTARFGREKGQDNRYGQVTRPDWQLVPTGGHWEVINPEASIMFQYSRWVPDDGGVGLLRQAQASGGGTALPVGGGQGSRALLAIRRQASGKRSVHPLRGGIYSGMFLFGLRESAAEAFSEASPLAGQSSLEAGGVSVNCFPAGTLVATPRGLFPIETIKARDDVWAYD